MLITLGPITRTFYGNLDSDGVRLTIGSVSELKYVPLKALGNLFMSIKSFSGFYLILIFIFTSCTSDFNGKETEMDNTSHVNFFKNSDPQMEKASKEAQNSFRYFWKEVTLDFNRIVQALELACIKLSFRDDPSDPEGMVESMWLNEIDFDGEKISGVLINTPNWLKKFKAGDRVECVPGEISDWMCVLDGKVYGAYTIQVLRKQMGVSEREKHDSAWGLNFPPIDTVLELPKTSKFEPAIAKLLDDHFKKDPSSFETIDEDGRSLLHLEALYGRKHSVEVLLKHGLDTTSKCNRGWTPADYARSLNWTDVLQQLEEAESKKVED